MNLILVILLLVWHYDKSVGNNKHFLRSILAFACINLILQFIKFLWFLLKFLKSASLSMITYLVLSCFNLIFLILTIIAFSNDAKNVTKYRKFLHVATFIYFFTGNIRTITDNNDKNNISNYCKKLGYIKPKQVVQKLIKDKKSIDETTKDAKKLLKEAVKIIKEEKSKKV
jgi:hypothetical protein